MIRITIKTDNAAFQDGNKAAELARILREMAANLDESACFRFCKVYDVNGNDVGAVTLTGPDRRL
jgi:hypothetical protein